MTLHYFNPWHDEALAARDAHCQPPLAARRLAADLAGLPLWWAQPGDLIVVWNTPPADSGETRRLTENPVTATETPERPTGKTVSRPAARPRPDVGQPRPMVSRVFLTDEGLPTFSSLTPLDGCTAAARALHGVESVAPWGWDAHAVSQLRAWGVASGLLPTPAWLDALRRLSSRHTAVGLLQALRDAGPSYVGDARWCTSEAEVRQAVESLPLTLLKAPWSGSGRGLRRGFGRYEAPLDGWVRRVLSRQGAVVVEPFFDRLADMAFEFELGPDGRAEFLGGSFFTTDATGRYTGSLVAPPDVLLAHMGKAVGTAVVERAAADVGSLLPDALPGYTGPAGVDLMAVAGRDGRPALHPCVEVNVRRTMGRVALDLLRWVAPGCQARLALRRPGQPAPKPEVDGGRLVRGSLPLTPAQAGTSVQAWLESV